MSLQTTICSFLFIEFEQLVREKEPKVIQHATEFSKLSNDKWEQFFEMFTKESASSRYTFEDLTKLAKYHSVRQIIVSIANNASFSAPLALQNCFKNPISTMKKSGLTITQALEKIQHTFYTRAVFTGHPTEFASDETITLISEITDLIIHNPALKTINRRSLRNKLDKLYTHKLTPQHKLSVEDEIARNLNHLHKIYLFIPKLRADIFQAFSEVYEATFASPHQEKLDEIIINSIEFRSWTGGDADGNFRIVADKMAKAINLHKHAASKFHLEYLDSVYKTAQDSIIKNTLKQVEPLIKDLALDKAIELLSAHKNKNDALDIFILLIKIFGKNVASIDVRQNMYILSKVVSDILLGIRNFIEEKAILSEEETTILKILKRFEYHKFLPKPTDSKDKSKNDEIHRIDILNAILSNPKIIEYASNLHLNGWFKERYAIVTEEISRMQMVTIFPNVFKNYIISNSEGVSSVLQMIFLAKICSAKPHIIPLFETKDSLDEARDILSQLLENDHYKKYLTGKSQKVMVGYSDSQKDNGICVLPLIAKAIESWQTISEQSGISIEVFHGNGLDLARGGPRIVEKEQTFQGSHIRYAFLNYEDAANYFATLLNKTVNQPVIKSCDLSIFVEKGCEAFAELRSEKGYFHQLEKFFQTSSPFELFIKPNNFSSRPSKRNTNDLSSSPYNIWFSDLVLDSEDIINGMRAIPWIITIEGTYTYFNLWYGVAKGIKALKEQYDIESLLNTCPIFKEIFKKIIIAIEFADFDLAWKYFPANERPKNNAALGKFAKKAAESTDNLNPKHFLALLHNEFIETKELITSFNTTLETTTLNEISFRKSESSFIRALMAWLNLKMVYNNTKVPALFLGATEDSFEAMCGAIYLAFNEYRTVPRSYAINDM